MSITDRSIRGNIASPMNGQNIDLGQVAYSNPRIPQAYNGNTQNVLNYILATMYPNYKGTVATPAALPMGAAPNDYYFVTDDGDGKSAGYVWAVVDNAGAWSKKYDVDWSFEGIFSETLVRTNYLYVSKNGFSQRDNAGVTVTGLYAGQTIYGGDATLQNLTFNANSKDNTGFIQTDNHFRPTIDAAIDLGTALLSWRTGYFKTSIFVGTLTILPGIISDSSGAISFASDNLTTTGSITGAVLKTGTMVISSGFISDSSGTISFASDNLTTTGTITGATGSLLADLTFSTGSITSLSPAISFGANNLSTTGSITGGQVNAANLRLSVNTISSTNTNGNIIVAANGTGIVDIQSPMTTLGQTVSGVLAVTGQINVNNLRLAGNIFSSTNLNGNITLSPNGTGYIENTSSIISSTDAVFDLGTALKRFSNLFLSGGISNGTTSISNSTLQSLRDINVGATSGMALFYNGSEWLPSLPDTEIDHRTISHLVDTPTSDAGHTQFVVLAGRTGGQIIQGGFSASEHLIFESTSNAIKGYVKTKDSFVSFTAPTYAGGWIGTDLGAPSSEFRNLYTKGEFIGARLENVLSSALPAASGQNIGRAAWATDISKLYIDTGGVWKQVGGAGKFLSDTIWDGVQTTQVFVVSSAITDARTCLWALHDNASDFEQIFCTIKSISATQVQVTVSPALAAGSYRLIGIE